VWLHAIAVAGVLVLGALATRPGSAYLSDEGAAILQSRQLSARGTWVYENPLPDLDRGNKAMPFPQGDEGAEGRAPYARHPLYPRLLQGAHAVAGTAGYVGLSILGTVLAALCAAALARRVRPGLAVPALWAVVVSPLFFDSMVVLAHTLAAAAVAAGLLAFVRSLEGERVHWLDGFLLVACTTLAAALRTEGVFFGMAVAVGALVAARRGVSIRRAGPLALLAVGAAAAVRVGEGRFLDGVLGARHSGVGIDRSRYGSGRVDGFVETWLLPGERPLVRVALLLLVGMAAIGVAALLVRMGRRDAIVAGLVAAGAGLYVARLLVGDPHPVPGLLAAFPLGLVAVLLVTRADLASTPAAAAGVVAGVIAVMVLLTQYPEGGSVEWGGRYFAVALPVAVVPRVIALARTWTGWGGGARRAAAGGLVVVTMATVALAGATLRDSHDSSRRLADAVEVAARRAGPARVGLARDTRPIVVTTESLLPQLLWPVFAHVRWLVAGPEDVPALLQRASRAGVRRLVLVSADPAGALAGTGRWYTPEPVPGPAPPVPLVVLNSR
jgi:hypothetical protein